MKALFISNDPTIFDSGSASRVRMRAYAAHMEELHILSSAGKDTKEEQEEHLFLHPVHASKLFRARTLTRRARVLIKTYGIEVVSAQDPFEHGLAALRATRGTHAKLHIQVHTDFLSPWFAKGARLYTTFLNRYRCSIADQVLPAAVGIRAVSERVKASLLARYGSRIPVPSVIPVVVSADVPESVLLPAHSFTFALIAVGRLEPEKRVEDILAALKRIVKQYPMVGLFIVGDGRERGRLEQMTRTLGLEQHVVFLGERSDARALLGSAQAFIQASAYEGYGRTLIEAALARIPIITTDVGIVGEVFKNDENVLVAPVADPAALAVAISKCIEDTKFRKEFPMRAETAAHDHLTAQGNLVERVASDVARLLIS